MTRLFGSLLSSFVILLVSAIPSPSQETANPEFNQTFLNYYRYAVENPPDELKTLEELTRACLYIYDGNEDLPATYQCQLILEEFNDCIVLTEPTDRCFEIIGVTPNE